jgi:uncharacterized repeat protein (TIGR03803 family)
MNHRRTLLSVIGLLLLLALPANTQTYTLLHSFDSTDGYNPAGGLVQANNGDLYGTTTDGGGAKKAGTIFRITPSGSFTALHIFDITDGLDPETALIQATNWNLYGTTLGGGSSSDGTIFEMNPSGVVTTLYDFCSQVDCADGDMPQAGLIQAPNGDFYGTTTSRGAHNEGTVFKLTQSGTLTTLYSFCSKNSCPDGWLPHGLIQATDGNFYGTTQNGGEIIPRVGTFFKISPGGTFATLHSFDYATEGAYPIGSLLQATNGKLYGTTIEGGGNKKGTVFSITTTGTLTNLYSFCSKSMCSDGSFPKTGLIQASNGNFYGTTFAGGAHGYGTIFEITPNGTLTTLHSFDSTDGQNPQAPLLQDTNGTFYGVAASGGVNGDGTVFSLSVGLGPFFEIQFTSGREGGRIGILGQDFNSSSIVKFGGVQAETVTLDGPTHIIATVPAGALTGSVTVTTNATTLTSTQQFKVLPSITSFTPMSGPVGTSVTITGTGLKQTTSAMFGTEKASSVTADSDTKVTADVPAGAMTGKIAVTTKGGSATSANSFTVNQL